MAQSKQILIQVFCFFFRLLHFYLLALPQMLQGIKPVLSTGLMHTEIVREIGGFDPGYKCYEDLEIPVLLSIAGKVGFLDEPVLFRREHQTNTSATTSTIRTDKILCYEKFLKNHKLKPYTSLIRYELRRAYLALGRHLNRTNGGSDYERDIFKKAWPYAMKDVRLFFHLVRWGRR